LPAIGELVRCTDGSWIVRPPTNCTRGRRLLPGWMLVGQQPCACRDGAPHGPAGAAGFHRYRTVRLRWRASKLSNKGVTGWWVDGFGYRRARQLFR